MTAIMSKKMMLCAAITLLFFVQTASSLKILMYSPRFGRSHVMFVGKLADQLAEAGHDVVLYQPIVTPEVANLTGSKLARVIERPTSVDVPKMPDMGKTWEPTSLPKTVAMMGVIGKMFKASCEQQLLDTKMMDRLRDEKFDIGIAEFFDVCGHGIFKRIGLEKTIVLYASAMPLDDATYFGLPATSSFVYDFVSDNSLGTFVGRFQNFVTLLVGRHFLMKKFTGQTAEAYAVFDKNLDYRDLIANSSYAFVNMDEHVDIPRPITHKYINIAGVGMAKALKNTGNLDKKYQEIFDNAKKGVVFFSLGTVASSHSMPNASKKAFLEAFAEFPDITFLWKYEKPEHKINEGYKNVFAEAWMPQKEILGHKKILAFITHGGANSITEATYAGIPLLTIPLFGDQARNALMLEKRGIGIQLDKSALTKDNIVKAIRKIVYDPSYNQKAKELSKIIRDKPMGPDERFVKYTEFAATHNIHESLDMEGRYLSFFAYYSLDVISVILVVFLLLITIIYYSLKFVVCRLCGKLSSKSHHKKE